MSKKPAHKPERKPSPPACEDNPHWLVMDPTGARPEPPVKTKKSALPLRDIEWPDFERLCRRMALLSGQVADARVYGRPGHAQQGIDILVRMQDGTFEVWQSKRYTTFGPRDVTNAVELFLQHEWAKQAKRFVLAVTSELSTPKVIDALGAAATALKEKGIVFEALGGVDITDRLRPHPDIIHDFFEMPWVDAVRGSEAVASLTNRLSRFDIEAVRVRLRDFYTAWIAIVDPGLPIAGQDKDGRPIPAPKLAQRYVLPDLVMNVGGIDQEPVSPAPPKAPTRDDPVVQVMNLADGKSVVAERPTTPQSRERTLSVDQFLASERRAVITADAGAGKTTLLRLLALEVLSDTSDIEAVRNNYAGYIPVWVPFSLWARMAEGKDHPPPLEDVVHAFIAAQNDVPLANDMRRALASQKIVLLVDGLDEARGDTAPDTVLAGLTTLVEMRNVPVIATSRPHGIGR